MNGDESPERFPPLSLVRARWRVAPDHKGPLPLHLVHRGAPGGAIHLAGEVGSLDPSLVEPALEPMDSECTRDPIFLFQRRRWIWTADGELPDGWRWGDDEREYLVDPDGEDEGADDGAARIHKDHGSEFVVETWETELVFMTRAEGEAYGTSRSYNYRAGWRVYAVCAEGLLADLLRLVRPIKGLPIGRQGPPRS